LDIQGGLVSTGTGAERGHVPPGPAAGRWERLFADLEAVAEYDGRAELAAEIADRTRGEVGRFRLTDRLRATVGHEVSLVLRTDQPAVGIVREVGPDWVLLAEHQAREVLVPLAAVCQVLGLGDLSAQPVSEGRVAAKLDLRYALRRLARDRAPLTVTVLDGGVLHGTCDRVGADFVEFAEHAPGEPRRAVAVRRVTTVPIGALLLVRSR
jgi:hypothetical protein